MNKLSVTLNYFPGVIVKEMCVHVCVANLSSSHSQKPPPPLPQRVGNRQEPVCWAQHDLTEEMHHYAFQSAAIHWKKDGQSPQPYI